MRRRIVHLLAAATLLTPTLGQALEQERIDALVREIANEIAAPGLSVAIGLPDDSIVVSAAGWSDVQRETPMATTIGMPGGSTGKTFVATLAMMLVGEAVLDLEAPIATWVGNESWFLELPNGPNIRLKHLLSHSAGLPDHVDDLGFLLSVAWQLWTGRHAAFTPVELVGFISDEPPLFAPGEGFAYTDTGYIVLGLVIEAATGRAYYDLVQERILTPLLLEDVRPAVSRTMPNVAVGYVARSLLSTLVGIDGRTVDEQGAMVLDPVTEWTGGGFVTTPTMLVRFFTLLGTGRVVPAETVERMVSGGYRDPATPASSYGYGMFVTDGKRGQVISHGGWYPGYSTYVAHERETRTTVALQTNRDGDDLNGAALAARLLDAVAGTSVEGR